MGSEYTMKTSAREISAKVMNPIISSHQAIIMIVCIAYLLYKNYLRKINTLSYISGKDDKKTFEGFRENKNRLIAVEMPKVGIEPTFPKEHDFESCASANSATPACVESISKIKLKVKVAIFIIKHIIGKNQPRMWNEIRHYRFTSIWQDNDF